MPIKRKSPEIMIACPPPAADNGTAEEEPEEKDKTNYIIFNYKGESYEVPVSEVDIAGEHKIE